MLYHFQNNSGNASDCECGRVRDRGVSKFVSILCINATKSYYKSVICWRRIPVYNCSHVTGEYCLTSGGPSA